MYVAVVEHLLHLKDKKSYKYEEGVSCPRCYDTLSNSQKTRFRMRQNQILAKKAGKSISSKRNFNYGFD